MAKISQDSWNKIGETISWEKTCQMEAAKKYLFVLFKAIDKSMNEAHYMANDQNRDLWKQDL